MQPTELTSRYVHAVVRLLPKADRADVAAELGTLIDDTLHERALAAGRQVDEALALDVLRSFGAPGEIAEKYGRPRQGLIGPAYLPAYLVTLRVVGALVAAVFVFSFVWSHSVEQVPWSDQFLSFAGTFTGLAGTLLVNVGLITILFAVLERFHPETETSDWDPLELPAVNDPDRLNRADRAAELGFDVVQLVVFNLVVRGGSRVLGAGAPGGLFSFSSDFYPFVPWMRLMFVASIAVSALLVWRGRWNRTLRTADVALGIYTLVLFLQILAGGDIVASHGLTVLLKLLLASMSVVVVFETGRQIWRLRPFQGREPAALWTGAKVI